MTTKKKDKDKKPEKTSKKSGRSNTAKDSKAVKANTSGSKSRAKSASKAKTSRKSTLENNSQALHNNNLSVPADDNSLTGASTAVDTVSVNSGNTPTGHQPKKVFYYELVWGQLKKNKLAVLGMWCISFLILMAIYAPLVAMDKPFYYSYEGKTTWPFFVALFDRNFFENGVDIFFNLLMVLSPLYLIAFIAVKKIISVESFRKHLFRILYWIGAVHVILFALIQVNPYTMPYRNYKYEIKTSIQNGQQISYMFPMIRYSYRETDITSSNPRQPSRTHLLGTDKEGRDVFVRMLYGTRISLTIGIVAVSIYVFLGIVVGATAGYFGGWVDLIISRLIEVMMCFPSFFLILTIAAFIEKRSIFHIMIIIGVTRWTGIARLIRGEFLRQRSMDYVQAAVALGIPTRKIIFGHVLPNAISPVLVAATFGVAAAILTESSLAFLGLGDTSAPSWGELLNVGRLERKMWLIMSPGMAIFFVVSVFNLVGEGLRDALDPKLRQ